MQQVAVGQIHILIVLHFKILGTFMYSNQPCKEPIVVLYICTDNGKTDTEMLLPLLRTVAIFSFNNLLKSKTFKTI